MTEQELNLVKAITNSASHILWLTGGNLLQGKRPDFSVAFGLSRAVMLEQPALKFFVLDIDDSAVGLDQKASDFSYILEQGLGESPLDFEFQRGQGTLHISRFNPAQALNSNFRQKQGFEAVSMQLGKVLPCRLSFEQRGQLESSFFKRLELDESALKSNHIEIAVSYVDLDAHSIDVLAGRVNTNPSALMLQSIGTITDLGSDVPAFSIGDRIVAVFPGHLDSRVRVPHWACLGLQDEAFNINNGLPMIHAYSTALHIVHEIVRVSAGV